MDALARQEIKERLRFDTPFWASHCAKVLNEDKLLVPLLARPWQLRFDAALEAQRAAGLPMRAIVLKARKLGFSTWVQAKFMQRVSQLPYQSALVVAHRRDAAGELIDMADRIYSNLPTESELGMGFSIKPQLVGESRSRGGARWMSLGDRLRPTEASQYLTLTAGAKGGGRAATPTLLHLSEVAHYEDPLFSIGMLNALPKRPETIAVKESTANGFNSFHDDWQRAVEGAEDPETGGLYVPLFFGWQDNPANSLRFANDDARARFERTIGDPAGGGDEEEQWLLETYGVTLEQLRWRRVTISEDCDGKIDQFHQEHPATPEQAFIGSGSPVFSSILVSRMISAAERAHEPVKGVLRAGETETAKTRSGTVDVPRSVLWVPDPTPVDTDLWGSMDRLLVWEHPVNAGTQAELDEDKREPDGQYVMFVDVAQGVESTTEARDFSAIQVLDHVSRMQVARYKSRIAMHDLPLVAFLIGAYYNFAIAAVEITGLGIAVQESLHKDYRYPNLYRRRRRGDDRQDAAQKNLLGWSTNPQTKPLMEQAMGQVLKTDTHGCRDVATGREFTTYVEDDRGKHGAQKGSHDDLVMAFMGAHRVAQELSPRDPSKKRTGRVRGYRP